MSSLRTNPSIPSRRGPRRIPAAAALVIALAFVLIAGSVWSAGCGSSDTETTTSAPAGTSGATTTSGATSTSEASTTSEAPTTTTEATTTTIAKLDKLTIVAPPGPMAIPMAYIAINDKLADVAEETELVIWENGDQLKAMVAGGQGDIVTLPSNNAAIFYNKGLELQLLNISVWNITYLVTADAAATSFTDIKGQSIVVSLQGSVPDVMFQFLAAKEGLDPTEDFELRYATDPTQAAQLLLAGQVDNAVLSEALATAVLLQTKTAAKPLRKAFAFDAAWIQATSTSDDTPIAGTVATANVMGQPEVLAAFEREYKAAVDWMLSDPEAAGFLVETELPQLGLKAAVMTAALQGITWRHTPAADARPYLERFYGNLSELSPEVIGGKLPDDGFYYVP